MEHVSSVRPTGKFPEKVENLKKRQTEVINKLSFQIIGAWELIANWYLRDILCKLNENELDNHENHN